MSTTTFGFETTAAEAASGIDLSGKRAIVTGAASGIGVETARALAGTGAEVTLAVRDLDAGARTADDIDGDVHVAHLDLADQASVKAFAAGWDGPLHVLVNNAGVMAIQELTRTPEGWEMQFATNHLGHFALALGLHDALAAGGSARIVSVSSAAHLRSPVVLDDIHFSFREYDPWLAYGQSKTANVLFAVEATRRWAADGITANALMPGGIATALQRHVDPEYMNRARQSGGAAAQDDRAGRRDVGTAGYLARSWRASAGATSRTASRRRSSIGATATRRRRRPLRARPGQRRAALGGLAAYARLMLISTMNDLPGYTVDEVLGEVFGLTVRSRNVGSQIGASLKSIVGGELKGMTKMLAEGRQHAQERLVEEATAKGADAVLAFRFDTSELGSTWTEICAYGTAVKVSRAA